MSRQVFWLLALGLPPLLGALSVLFCYQWISWTTRHQLHDHPQTLPTAPFALVLGTSKLVSNGNPNTYFQERMKTALQLWKAGRVKKIILSGDNRTQQQQTEVDDMTATLVQGGVPGEAILADGRGLRTWLSMCNYAQAHKEHQVIVVSQRFHNQRALFLARHLGLKAVALNAPDVPLSSDLYTPLREWASRLRAFFDVFFSSCPRTP